ncbi:outer membrane beta-barrel protein [Rubrivirga sp. IMCC43871]|uniref:outer membrane beta-barrel protein n=1 Tax=Rubrivirga sp. IMCC43871 TaxID=3391575 RepID=UPI00398FB902
MTRAFVLAALALCAAPALAQTCSRALPRAQESYQTGDFDATIDRLTSCLDADRFSTEERRNAYRLIGLSYIGKDREADARDAVARLLEVAPNYEADPALDPPPFVRLVSEERRRRPSATGGPRRAASSRFGAAVRAHGLSYSDSDSDSFTGGGGDLTLGYDVTPSITVYTQLRGSSGNGDGALSVALGGVSLGGRFAFGHGKVVPYIGAGAAYQTATFDATGLGSLDYSGPGGELEGGVLYALSRSLSLTGGVGATFTTLSTDGRPDDISATTIRLGVGLSWRP